MKKTLLIAAAALAAATISSQAQVYSLNIVGYVNIPAKAGYVNIANPLDNGANTLTNLIDNTGGKWDFTTVFVWAGTHYNTFTIDSSMSTGVADAGDSFAVPAPIIPPGQGIFFYNNTGASNTLTVAGTVHTDAVASGTNTVGINTNTLATLLTLVGSKTPVGGGLASVLQFPAKSGALDFSTVQVPIITGGNISGFTTYTVDSSFPSGFADAGDSVGVPEPVIPVGQGFFFYNNLGAPAQWIQSL